MLRLKGKFNTGVYFIFMVCFTLNTIKEMNKMQVGNFIFLFLCLLFCVYTMRFISMVIAKENIFTCVIYAVTVCGTNRKQSLSIRTDHSSVYDT